MIEVKHLTKYYGDHAAVEDLSFTVRDGSICGFLGPNGAGKTTTLNMLTGFLAPTEGDIIVNGHDILEEPSEAKRTIGYLPEQPPLYQDMTVEEYLGFTAELKGVPRKERKAEIARVQSEMELNDVGQRLIRNLSKGYRQRVGLAQAMIGSPQTLILDEPTNGLDPKQTVEIRNLIRRLGEKHTVIFSSHILSEVSEICDEVLILSHGELAACGDPGSIRPGGVRGETLLVLAEGDPETIRKALEKAVPLQATDLTVTKDGNVQVRVALQPDEKAESAGSGDEGGDVILSRKSEENGGAAADLRKRISRSLVEAGAGILEMRTETESLEDIFLRLTEDEDEGKMTAREANTRRNGGESPDEEDGDTLVSSGRSGEEKRRGPVSAGGKFFGRKRRRHDGDL